MFRLIGRFLKEEKCLKTTPTSDSITKIINSARNTHFSFETLSLMRNFIFSNLNIDSSDRRYYEIGGKILYFLKIMYITLLEEYANKNCNFQEFKACLLGNRKSYERFKKKYINTQEEIYIGIDPVSEEARFYNKHINDFTKLFVEAICGRRDKRDILF